MKGYTDKTTLENYTLQTIDASFDLQITAWIEAIEKYIEQYTGRVFIADEEASERVYDGNNRSEILIDDFIAIETLKIDDEEIAEADYLLYPANSEKKNRIRLKNRFFTYGEQNIVVEANWGYSSEVPADIKLAATILLAGIILYSDKVTRSETIGSYSVSYDTDKGWQDFENAKNILNMYKKHTF